MPPQAPVPHDPTDSSTEASSPEVARPGPRPGPRALVEPMRRILRTAGLAAAVALPVAGLVGYLAGGAAGAWGALIGMGIAVVFLAVTVVVALATARTEDAGLLGFAVLASWLVKIIVLIAVMAFLRGQDFYSRPALFIALLVGTAGTLFIEWRVVVTTRVPYVEPQQR